MASKQWISAAILTAGTAALLGPPAHAQSVQVLPAATAPSDLSVNPQTLVDGDLSSLNVRLTRLAPPGPRDDPAIQQERDDAARRLLSRPSPQATRYLLDALQATGANNATHDAKLAVARAVADDAQPSPVFVSGLLPLLGPDRPLTDAGARALAHFGTIPPIRERLINFVQTANLSAPMRAGVIRNMGGIISRDVADALVTLAGDTRQGATVQNAAGDALGEMTGQTDNLHDAPRWKTWQAGNANKPEVIWRADLLNARESRLSHDDRAQGELANELKQILSEQYQQATRVGKFAMVLRLLNAANPGTRIMGMQLVVSEHDNANPFPPQALKRLEELVGDSDSNVRLTAAQAIKSLNDTDAIDAILTQLPQETNVDVKLAQILALKQMKQVKAVVELRQLLHDPLIRVATEAVTALKDLSSALLAQNPGLAQQVADEVWQAGMDRKAEPGGAEFQILAIEAVGRMHSRGRTTDLLNLLNVNTPERIRSASLHALADLGDPKTADLIARWLDNEPSPLVRVEAINALGSTSSFELAAATLFRYTSPNTEPDKAVRERAWVQFQSLLPSATNLAELTRWADQFKDDATRRLPVLLALNEKFQRSMQWEDLAASRQNTGDTYMDPRLADPTRAAIQYQEALDYWQKRNVANQVTETLVKHLLKALLASKQYKELADFGGRQIATNRAQQTIVGPMIRDEAERLYNAGLRDNDPQKFKDAQSLIDNALKMTPGLDERYLNDLRQFQKDIETRPKRN